MQSRRRLASSIVLLSFFAASLPACSGDAAGPADSGGPDTNATADGAAHDSGGAPCTSAASCDDGLYCNGAETCTAGRCAAGGTPPCDDAIACTVDQCVESTRSCSSHAPDADGDGFFDTDCHDSLGVPLGDDCDDHDPLRYPGRTETCDPVHDEDCNLATFGFVDADGDGHPSAGCCNAGGACGDDCNDASPNVHPSAAEVCNGIDDDCDVLIDEAVTVSLYPDVDHDGYGDASATAMAGCPATPGYATMQGDCDDAAPSRHVGATEVCNGIDDDCDTVVDDIVDGMFFCAAGDSRSCTTTLGSLAGHQTCGADCRSWNGCVAPEACNGYDDDGNGTPDDGFACVLGAVSTCTTTCGTSGVRTCQAGCVLGPCHAAEVCNFCDDDGLNGFTDEAPLATTTDAARRLEPDSSASPPITTRTAGVATAEAVWTGSSAEYLVHLLDGASADQAGAYWVDLSRYQGWGPTAITAELHVHSTDGGQPMGGWSVVMATGGTGDVGTPRDTGVPLTRTGARFDWLWGLPYTFYGDTADRLAYARLPTSWRGTLFVGPSAAEIGRAIPTQNFDSGRTTDLTEQMIITYQPEDTTTGAREERVSIAFPATATGSCTSSASCGGNECVVTATTGAAACMQSHVYAPDADGNTADPSNDVPIGSRLSIGITAGSYTYTFRPPGAPMDITYSARVVADLYLHQWTPPPSGSGASPTETVQSAIRRTRTCAGGY